MIERSKEEEQLHFLKIDMFVNTQEFRREALHFLKHGYYCADPMGSVGYYEYWSEQLRRCREGYSVGGEYLTGDHYFYLNFNQIKLTQTGGEAELEKKKTSGRKIVTFPNFWDGDHAYFTSLKQAQDTGKHLIVGKARRKGFSYKNASVSTNQYSSYKNTYTLLCAFDKKYLYPKGIMTMVSDNMNFLNQHTGWAKRRQAVDKQNHRRASYLEYINGQSVERGYKSEVEAITFKDNPDAARGKDASLIIFEEAGTFDNLKASYLATKPCVEDGDITTGTMVLFGTGGDLSGGAIDFESMFYNPEAYNLMSFENEWDEGAAGTSCGFFFPSYKNKIGYMDSHGNSLTEKAKQAEDAHREQIKRDAKDPGVYDKHCAEYPWCPRESFIQESNNLFPTGELMEHRNHVLAHGLHKNLGIAGKLVDSGKGVKFRPDDSARPIEKFPHDKRDNLKGAVVVYQSPHRNSSGVTPNNMYIIVHDPFGSDGGGASLGSAYVLKRPNRHSQPDDMIVASYVGRTEYQDEYNEILFKLAEYYNAKIGFENDRGEVIPYAKRFKKLHWLMTEVEIFDQTDGVRIKKLGRKYGCSMGSSQRKGQAEIYLRDWLRSKRGKDEQGNQQMNLHQIYDLALLEELIKYNSKKGNFDRVSAMLVGMYHLKDLHNKVVETAVESDGSDFWNREFFN
jgi:hypothetical protein